MGLLDSLQKAAMDVAPIAKDLASEAGRTAKAVGETIKEEQPMKKAASGAGKAIRSASSTVRKEYQGKQQEREIDRYAELKAQYPGKTLLFARRYYYVQFIKNEKYGIKDIDAFRGISSGLMFLDEYKRPLYIASGDFTDEWSHFRLIDANGKTLGKVSEHGLIKKKASIYFNGDHFSGFPNNLPGGSKLQLINGVICYGGQPCYDKTTEKDFDLLLVHSPSLLVISALVYTAYQILLNPAYHGGGG